MMRIFALFGIFLGLNLAAAQEMEMTTKFDWHQVLVLPKEPPFVWEGRQVINFFPWDKYYKEKDESKAFVEAHFQNAEPINTDAGHLRFASDHALIQGAYLEMGVCTGRTINFIAALNPEKIIYGFDSFEGLTEDWNRGRIVPQKTFAFKNPNMLPAVLHNVRLVRGLFKDTLPKFKEEILKDTPISFIHIDCDLYDPTKTVFEILKDNLVSGSVIAFDEYYNYPGYQDHEYKAFQEFLADTGKKARPIAFNQYFEQASFMIE